MCNMTAQLSLKVRMLKAEVVETLFYGCATWTLSTKHFSKLRSVHLVLLRVIGLQGRQRTDRTPLSYAKALKKTRCESMKTSFRKQRLLFAVAVARQKNESRLPSRVIVAATGREGPRPGGQSTTWHIPVCLH